MTLEETIDFIFLLTPFIKYIREIIKSYNNNLIGSEQFRTICEMLLALSNKDNVLKAFSIIYHIPEDVSSKLSVDELVLTLPIIIKENNLLELLYTFRALGAFNE